MSKRFKISEGDWICSQEGCENINYARRTECHKCRYPRPKYAPKLKKVGSEIGRHAAKKSGGLFSAEDWQCSMCSNINWARRFDCNVCEHPKMGKVEERTGIGGGFNEREEVEYIKRESDEEYDDFGRKKKKQSGIDRKNRDTQIDEDLSKYDLGSGESDDDVSKYDLETTVVGDLEKRAKLNNSDRDSSKRDSGKLSSKRRYSSSSSLSPVSKRQRHYDRYRSDRKIPRDRSRSPRGRY